ncbi:TetR family transcriptional regulator C-terminal domain-containing protein [Streptacidiphilus sp. ASG 303]|uniref:TetR/AcrR family transcriptional regulator n=1 Tax=Streptacidiphilus sp. ASG 303 TaxID=2896847 RepID=UPI001E2F1991|nr:TetR/AcrR family transcriptional regulator [Streptacidiphilus sp. ASG 303]MCD0485755.1 TetR family transcriptional regulator C-terminal domain-containing protein [Streptacidiphilus sp. ASG 303]
MSDRELLLLDAAIGVLAHGGIRRLTHRAVDARAGVPTGSTSNRFRTREALLTGVLGRLLERETALWTGPAVRTGAGGIDGFAVRLGSVVEALGSTDRELTLARHAVFAEAARQPALRTALQAARRRLAAWLAPLLADLGSHDPAGDLRRLLALVDGLLAGQLVDPEDDFTPAPAIAALLHGLIDPRSASHRAGG